MLPVSSIGEVSVQVGLLETIEGPDDLRRLDAGKLPKLAEEIRDFLVSAVAKTGGHLGPNLGAVELTLALHRVFDSPFEPIIFDTGHQAYVHKIITGRRDGFARLRQRDGLSGYPSRAESEHDWVENSHASTALSYADGMAKGFAVQGIKRTVVAVVGDGALTGGMCWEALNNIAAAKDRSVVVVVNDNGRSYSPTIGGLAEHLTSLRTNPRYEKALLKIKEVLSNTPLVGEPLYDALHGMKKGLKDVLTPQGLFEDLGLKYVGPINGHDVAAMESAFSRARREQEWGGAAVAANDGMAGRRWALDRRGLSLQARGQPWSVSPNDRARYPAPWHCASASRPRAGPHRWRRWPAQCLGGCGRRLR